MNINERIKKYQVERNWSITYMALEADLSPNTVSGWFKKNAVPTLEALKKLCKAFGITVSEFFNETDAPYSYLTESQQELLIEYNLLDQREKDDIIRLIKTRNELRHKNPQ